MKKLLLACLMLLPFTALAQKSIEIYGMQYELHRLELDGDSCCADFVYDDKGNAINVSYYYDPPRMAHIISFSQKTYKYLREYTLSDLEEYFSNIEEIVVPAFIDVFAIDLDRDGIKEIMFSCPIDENNSHSWIIAIEDLENSFDLRWYKGMGTCGAEGGTLYIDGSGAIATMKTLIGQWFERYIYYHGLLYWCEYYMYGHVWDTTEGSVHGGDHR